MKQKMQFAELFCNRLENGGDIIVLRYITRQDQGLGSEGAGQFLDIFLEALALISECEFGAGFMPGLGNGPRNGAFVSHTEDDSCFASELRHEFCKKLQGYKVTRLRHYNVKEV